MKTLQERKDDYAKDQGREDFDDFLWHIADSEDGVQMLDEAFDSIGKEYGKQCAEEQALKDSAEKHLDTHKTLSAWEQAKEDILSTPILTP